MLSLANPRTPVVRNNRIVTQNQLDPRRSAHMLQAGDGQRPDGMTQPGGNNFARYAEYDYLGRMSSLQMLETAAGSTYATQTWSYNGLGQMTRQTISGQVDIEYRFSTTQNDGRITHRKDWISG